VAYTDPEIAWVGVTEREAKEKGLKIGVGKFPWAASGRAIGIDRTEGFTKLIFDEDTHRIVGGGIVGVHAGELISEVALAIEMGSEAADIGLTIHPHPTLSESKARSLICTCRRRSEPRCMGEVRNVSCTEHPSREP
jgi:dihydrolipoamide dehydrogenase